MQRRGARITGPYGEKDGVRYVIHDGKGNRSSVKAPTEAAALQAAEETLALIASSAVTIEEAIDAYRAYLKEKGDRPSTLDLVPRQLRTFFAGAEHETLGDLTTARAARLYEALRTRHTERGRPPEVATHQAALASARAFGSWAVRKGLHRGPSPLEGVEPVGRRHRGKPQPRIDEARAWLEVALDLGEEWPGAICAAAALLMGLRAGELVSRTPRDLDDGGRLLWIGEEEGCKTGQRQVEVPEVLRRPLLRLCVAKLPAAPLFGFRGVKMVTWWTRKVWDVMCDRRAKAGLDPLVEPKDGWRRLSAHSLRGLHATLALQAGATAHVVAGALGHSPAMLRSAYAQPGAAEAGASQRALMKLVK